MVSTWSDAGFSLAEMAALHYTERMFIDHDNIDQELFDELREHFTERQIVELGWAVVSYLGFGRLIHTFGLRSDSRVD
ncbi:MAG: hypothetical protein R3B97_03555 [Dehalococcoidia bacterium]|nr:hypothetical protein [Dehalococcoidia bacterium]MCA9830960.1 hypothetical protein [Dehalococcoidia bacterium]MCB9485604.1 hypothetical protein [Thermoflexaceae bacterium]